MVKWIILGWLAAVCLILMFFNGALHKKDKGGRMSRYYLIHETRYDEWYVRESGIDYKRNRENEQVNYKADTLPEMLHKIQDNKDWRFYAVNQTRSSRGRHRGEVYPHHRHICTLAGFIPEACDIREQPGKMYFDEKWSLQYISELWVCPGGWDGQEMYKVADFTDKMGRAVDEYMEEHGLTYGMESEDE